MMTNIQQNQSNNQIISKYCVDSFKLIVDQDVFTSINIPNEFKLIDNEGEIIDEFKKNSIRIKYNETDIYIGAYTKQLRDVHYKKVCILFSSKVSREKYFDGITKDAVYDVLNHLKAIGKLDFNNIENVYKSIYVRDLDIKKDFILPFEYRERIQKNNEYLKSVFNHNPERCKIATKNIGLQANYRDNSSYTKPFCKFYDKYTEIVKRNVELYKILHEDIQQQLKFKFVYRWEFTLKNKDYFTKFDISDKLEDILILPQEKWQEISNYMYNANFGLIPKKRKMGTMSPTDHIMALMFQRLHKEGVSVHEIRDMFMNSSDEKNNHKNRQLEKFEKIYAYVTFGETSKQVYDENEFIKEWNKLIFG